MADDKHEALDDFQRAFGTQCRLAAQALAEGHSREAVRVAFVGNGDNIALGPMRTNRATINMIAGRARRALVCAGMTTERATELLIKRMRESRDAIEGEWGKTMKNPCETHPPGSGGACPSNAKDCIITERWERMNLPVVNMGETAA